MKEHPLHCSGTVAADVKVETKDTSKLELPNYLKGVRQKFSDRPDESHGASPDIQLFENEIPLNSSSPFSLWG
jgi:hypothetical protein